jgi:GT2 family glycosyltransferase/glycosyltransferase involved in cell wall biosynthesis/Flp pilus assembly protein TadD/predicted SAM-dependent methyltransferase
MVEIVKMEGHGLVRFQKKKDMQKIGTSLIRKNTPTCDPGDEETSKRLGGLEGKICCAFEGKKSQITWEYIEKLPFIKLYAGDIVNDEKYNELIGLSLTQSDHNHINHDICDPLPLPDNSVDYYQAEDVFEHIEYDKLLPIINEIHRVLKPNATFRLSVPDYGCDVLIKRSVKDDSGNIVFDPEGGGTLQNPGHLWFPNIDLVRRLLEKSKFNQFGRIEYLHYYNMDGTFVAKKINYSKGYIHRTPDFDNRVQDPYRPISIVVDLIKDAAEAIYTLKTNKLKNTQTDGIQTEKYYSKNQKYFAWQKEIGKFGGRANLIKFQELIMPHYDVIDFGCGGGYLLKELNCHLKVGIEVNVYAREEAWENGIRVVERMEEIPDAFAHAIISNHALEHLENPLKILRKLKKKLKKNGRAIFVVPHQDINEEYNANDRNNHLFTWNKQTIGNLFTQAGFKITSIDLIQHQWPPNYEKIYEEKGEDKFHKICREYAQQNNNYQIRIVAENPSETSKTISLSRIKDRTRETPVVLMTYNRPWHTKRILEALQQHKRNNIHIFSDGAKWEQDIPKVAETRELIKKIDWCEPVIIERQENFGLAKSIVSAVNSVFKDYDNLILLEDDCVPQKYFFDFIETCLDKYTNHEKIFGISGYTVPAPDSILDNYPYDLYFFPRIGSWGWATWKRAWQHFEPDLARVYKKAIENNIDLSQGGDDIPLMLNEMLSGKLKDVWTLHWVLTVYLNKGYYIYPTISHIENIGMDGTGIHCGKTDKFLSRIANQNPSKFPDNVIIDEGIYQNFRNYYDIPKAIPKIAKKSPKTSNQLKVVHLSTQDFGGAGKAAYRLHKGLQTIGVDSAMLVLNKQSGDSSVKVLPIDYTGGTATSLDVPVYNSPQWMKQFRKWHKLLSNYPKRPAGLEIFTDAESDIRIDLVQEIRDADIINLHWVAGEIDFPGASIALGNKPVVWTLHDMNPFTGGCHYAGDCLNYKTSCGACPQLGSDTENDLSNHVWKQKYDVYKTLSINIVTPSRWLGKCAAESKLFSPFPVTLIPYGFPIDIFMPYPKAEIRKQLNIPESAKVILFGADSVVNARKGFIYLLEALNRHSLKSTQDSVILTFGSFPEGVKFSSRYPVYNLGRIADENQLAMAYSAADVFVIPSLEDNLPNTVLEAMACGVPVVGFNIGGVPDMVDHKKTGFLVRPRDIAGLIEGIDWVISSSDSGTDFSEQCRKKVEKGYALEVQAKAYCELYSGILQDYLPLEEEIRTKAGKLNQQGEDLFKKGDLEGALNAFTRAIEINPNLATAHNNLGVLYYNRGEKDKALNQYQQGAKLAPKNITFQKNLADFYYVEQDRMEEAMRIYVKVLNENPEDLETLLALAHICVTLEKFDDAKYFSSRILKIEPGNKDAIKFLEALEKCQLSVEGAQKDQANIEAGSDEYFVSAIVSAYNSERFLRGCLEDLENQTIADKVEIIVVISGSKQNEEVIVKEFQKKYQNIKCIKTKQRETLYESWNRGIKVASGKYITNANTDDRHKRDALEILAGALDSNPTAALAYGDCLITENENGTFEHHTANRCYIFPEFSKRQMLARQFFGPQPMWRKSVHEKIGYFNPEYVVCGDWDFFIRLGTEFHAIHIPEFLGLYCRRDDSVERSNKDRNKNEQREIYGKYRNAIFIEEIYPNLDRQNIDNDAYAAAYADLGNIFMMSSRDLDSARKAFEKGLEYKNDSVELLNNLALSFLFDEQMDEAQMIIDSIKDNPDHRKRLRQIIHNYSNKRLIPEKYALMSIPHPLLNDLPPVSTGSLEHSLEEGKKIQEQQKIYINYTAFNKFESAIAEFKDNNFRYSERLIKEYKYLVNYNLFSKTDNRNRELPRISIIIVTYSKNGELLECINSVEKQSINGFEIIVVDNGNNSKVECALKEKRILYIKSPKNFFPAEGRNIGVSFARGAIIAFLDDDATVHDNYINSIRKAFETYKICGFRGKIIPKSESIYNKNARHYNLGDIPIPNSIDIEGNSAFLKDVYLEMNGMNPILYGSEGLEFSYRISKKYGVFETIYWPETIIYHDFAADAAKYQNKLIRHNFSKKYLLDKYPDIYNYYNFLNSYSQNIELANKGESLLNRV